MSDLNKHDLIKFSSIKLSIRHFSHFVCTEKQADGLSELNRHFIALVAKLGGTHESGSCKNYANTPESNCQLMKLIWDRASSIAIRCGLDCQGVRGQIPAGARFLFSPCCRPDLLWG